MTFTVPEDINRLLQAIIILRKNYHKELTQQKIYTRGFQYLRASDIVGKADFAEFDQVLFCNFFYFNRCEEEIIKDLHRRDKATLIFQGDERKWPVLKRIAKTLKTEIVEGPAVKTPSFALKLYAGFNGHAQVAWVREILKKIKNLKNTVIVLPNPDALVPLLSEITNLDQDFNISMGYPLKRSSLYALLEFIFKAQESKKEKRYYSRDYLKVLSHPFIKNLKITDNSTVSRILIHKIEEILTGKEATDLSGSLFFNLKDMESLDDLYVLTQETLSRLDIHIDRSALEEILKTLHQILFLKWEKVGNFKQFAGALEEFLNVLVEKSFLHHYPLNINIAARISDIKEEFLKAQFNKEEFPQEDIFRIFDSKLSREMVAFKGSPLKGLQILGLFETRSLNFEEVIVLDVNEGVLPYVVVHEPLIPREVMISLDLDRLELEEEIQRYQFMRLISSAKNVHLVYQESKDKERSRFVEELVWQEEKQKKAVDAVPVSRASFEVKVNAQRKIIPKTKEMVETLKKHTFSASSINMYLRNPVEFYYNYVLGLREQEDLLDEPEARHVGTFVHELLHESFKPFINKTPKIDEVFRKRFNAAFENKFEQTLAKQMHSDSFLLYSVLKERLARFLNNEQFERKVKKVLFLETRFQDHLSLSCGDIKFSYIIDRIDQLEDDTVTIIDYKTGGIDQMPKAIDRISNVKLSRESIRDTVVSFQLPLYFHYLNREFKGRPVDACLYNLRTIKLHSFLNKRASSSKEDTDQAFLRALDFVVGEILDPAIPFIEDAEL